ncbi:uncharacterized protein TRIADDRAFT_61221 [Trichoplax adhaerens]|uniref:PWI domain-containing protein n=1 Tax=Trichoplax adhaerens TaxID=10228 RepID=B3SAD4_TRIAD|nr:hypothetical protein TRIADDRAFT_61221 [Trichoplax adhaerens]EDV20295.1 hypothetical protein TRIADDRAFT_61221 [Trichoplax adhaerens]|eukprot:XP_002117245.1 hypothetical protein TRIADDRAFT_61221 [Trichoplax adhaerens]
MAGVPPPMARMPVTMPTFNPFARPPMPPNAAALRGAPAVMPPVPPGVGVPPHMMQSIPPIANSTMPPAPLPTTTTIAQPATKPATQRQQMSTHETTEKPKTTTVFVGNITEVATDTFIRQLLMKCGTVVSWKRIQGATGKLQPFGFCEYADPEATLRALRLLHGLQVGEKELLIKVDEKNRKRLDEYLARRRAENNSDTVMDIESADLSPDQEEEDISVKAEIDMFLKANWNVLAGKLQNEFIKESPKPSSMMNIKLARSEENLEDLEMDADQKNLISREIRIFRETYKDKKSDKEKEKESDRKEKEVSQETDRRIERDIRSREPSADQEMDENKIIEKRRLDRKLRERESMYKSELRSWESRERKKLREYEKSAERDSKLKKETEREIRHLLDFLAKYDDDEDDHRYYKGSAFTRRLRDREAEIASDERDRQRELEELERKSERKRANCSPPAEPDEKPVTNETITSKEPPVDTTSSSQPIIKEIQDAPVDNTKKRPRDEDENAQLSASEENKKSGFGLNMKIGLSTAKQQNPAPNTKKSKFESVFNNEDDESVANEKSRKRKLVPLEYTEEEMKAITPVVMTPDEKKRRIKAIMESIPSDKEKLFDYPLNWSLVDESLIEKRMRTWVIKKITEYIGEEEPTLVDFICEKVKEHNSPVSIVKDLEMVLDDEAEVFVMKLWRLLIYETEAKKMGIVNVK